MHIGYSSYYQLAYLLPTLPSKTVEVLPLIPFFFRLAPIIIQCSWLSYKRIYLDTFSQSSAHSFFFIHLPPLSYRLAHLRLKLPQIIPHPIVPLSHWTPWPSTTVSGVEVTVRRSWGSFCLFLKASGFLYQFSRSIWFEFLLCVLQNNFVISYITHIVLASSNYKFQQRFSVVNKKKVRKFSWGEGKALSISDRKQRDWFIRLASIELCRIDPFFDFNCFVQILHRSHDSTLCVPCTWSHSLISTHTIRNIQYKGKVLYHVVFCVLSIQIPKRALPSHFWWNRHFSIRVEERDHCS